MRQDIIDLLTQAATTYGVSPDLAIAVAARESGGSPTAVSPAGAEGVMQLMPATAASLGVTDPFNPAQNIDAGVRYLSSLLQQFGGDVRLALAAYNWGPGNVSRHGFNNWPQETVNYVSWILSRAGMSSPAADTSVATTDPAPLVTGDGTTPGDSTVSIIPLVATLGIGLWLLYRVIT